MGLRVAVAFGVVAALGCSGDSPAPGADAGVLAPTPLEGHARILWVGAHPDDELPSAPVFQEVCARAECVFVSMTVGERGNCHLADGCQPDLPTVRRAEFAAMGRYLRGEVEIVGLPDGSAGTPEGVVGAWAARAGSERALVDQLRALVERHAPDAIVSFDPRHGTTCHPDHRATGQLVVVAADELGFDRDAVFLVESVIVGVGDTEAIGFRPADPEDPTVAVISIAPRFEAIVHLMTEVYPSQFAAETVAGIQTAGPDGRTWSVLPVTEAVADRPAYRALCP